MSLFEQSALVLAILSVLVVTTSLIVLYYKRKYTLMIRDERIRHQQLEQNLRERLMSIDSILDHYPEPVVYKNSKGEYDWCNRELEKLWGLSRNNIMGSTPESLFPQESDEIRKLDSMVRTRSKPLVKERKFTDRDGETRTYELSFHQMDDPVSGGKGVLMYFKDISHYRDQLDILNDLYVTVREDLQLRSDYYADFLKTGLPPLNRIIEDSDTLLHNDNDRKETRKKLERITSSGQEMNWSCGSALFTVTMDLLPLFSSWEMFPSHCIPASPC
jgi:PAS domain S-box-containing protein